MLEENGLASARGEIRLLQCLVRADVAIAIASSDRVAGTGVDRKCLLDPAINGQRRRRCPGFPPRECRLGNVRPSTNLGNGDPGGFGTVLDVLRR